MEKLLSLWITVVIILFQVQVSKACTGITLTTKDNSGGFYQFHFLFLA